MSGMNRRDYSRKRRQYRIRKKFSGTPERPRLNVYRSLQNIFVQVIDDRAGRTLCAASSLDKEAKEQCTGKSKSEQAVIIGKLVAERAKAKGIDAVVFDRGGFRYHGRIKALADSAREAGLKF